MATTLRHRLSTVIDPEMNTEPGLSGFNQLVVAGILMLVIIGVLETEVHFIRHYGGLSTVLKGVLFVDRLSSVEKMRVRSQLQEMEHRHEAAKA